MNLIKNYIAVIITIVFLICPSICFSSYLIELKNGSKFITYQYWEEDNQIKFYFYGGVVGIEKHLVRKIRDSDLSYKEEVVEQVTSQTTKMPDKELYPETDMTNEDIEFYKNAKKDLMEKYRKAKNKLDKAIIDRDKIAKREAKKELKEIHDKLSDLSNELKSENKEVLPDWW